MNARTLNVILWVLVILALVASTVAAVLVESIRQDLLLEIAKITVTAFAVDKLVRWRLQLEEHAAAAALRESTITSLTDTAADLAVQLDYFVFGADRDVEPAIRARRVQARDELVATRLATLQQITDALEADTTITTSTEFSTAYFYVEWHLTQILTVLTPRLSNLAGDHAVLEKAAEAEAEHRRWRNAVNWEKLRPEGRGGGAAASLPSFSPLAIKERTVRTLRAVHDLLVTATAVG